MCNKTTGASLDENEMCHLKGLTLSPPQKRPFLSNLLCHCKKVADIFSKTRPFYCEGSQTISGTRTSFRSARVAVLILPSIQRLNLYVGQCQWCLPLGLIQIISTATGPLFCKLSLHGLPLLDIMCLCRQ